MHPWWINNDYQQTVLRIFFNFFNKMEEKEVLTKVLDRLKLSGTILLIGKEEVF